MNIKTTHLYDVMHTKATMTVNKMSDSNFVLKSRTERMSAEIL